MVMVLVMVMTMMKKMVVLTMSFAATAINMALGVLTVLSKHSAEEKEPNEAMLKQTTRANQK